jgi:hypothetical protein
MTWKDAWEKERKNHLGDYGSMDDEYDLECAFRAGYNAGVHSIWQKPNKKAKCDGINCFVNVKKRFHSVDCSISKEMNQEAAQVDTKKGKEAKE